MTFPVLRSWSVLLSCLLISAAAACGSKPEFDDGSNRPSGDGDGDGDQSMGGEAPSDIDLGLGGENSNGGSQNGSGSTTGSGSSASVDLDTLEIVYDGPGTLDVLVGEDLPTIDFDARVSGDDVEVGWSLDRGELGSIDQDGVFTPTGAVGGMVTIRAGLNDKVVEVSILIRIIFEQNGPTDDQGSQVAGTEDGLVPLKTGGGIGGVGGEGLGASIDDEDLLDLIAAGATEDGSDQNLELLYPYDGTVFPRGMLAPLFMWRWDVGDADAVKIELETASGSYRWSGTFGRPAILELDTPELRRATRRDTEGPATFVRHPIPQDVWAAATQSAGGSLPDGSSDTLSVNLTVVHDDVAYGPLTRTFGVAAGRMSGIVYYNSYGTQLVTNYEDFGAAVLSIASGDDGPEVVSGLEGSNGCRVCHTVSSQGNSLLVQGGPNDGVSWWNELEDGTATETQLVGQNEIFAWAGLSSDGKFALTNAVNLSNANPTVSSEHPYTRLWDMSQSPPVELDVTGLPTDLKAALPNFSPDDSKVSFAYLGGGTGEPFDSIEPGSHPLMVMDFDADSLTFENPRVVAYGTINDDANYRPHGAGFPSITPTNESVVFMNEVRGARVNESYIGTRERARGELWWTSTEGETGARLNYANGMDPDGNSTLPVGPNNHGLSSDDWDDGWDDSTLQYEPTVNPVTTGGLGWVVFTSRRMYGNLAVQDPWVSDPRDYDEADYDKITTKKLWVAAMRLDGSMEIDPSYPAFYLPGQELQAGNARGYWVLDPCRDDGMSCESGDQCCGGFCQPTGEDGALVCGNTTTTANCSQEQEKCDTADDCCSKDAECINHFCAISSPPPPPPTVR